MLRSVLATATILAGTSAAHAVGYTRVLDFDTVNAGGDTTVVYSIVPSADGFYSFLSGVPGSRITHTQANGSGWSTSELVSKTAWENAGGDIFTITTHGTGISGNYLQLVDTNQTEAIWRVDLTTGTPSQYVTNAAVTAFIQAATGDSTLEADLNTTHTVAPNGEHVAHEAETGYMLRTTGVNTVEAVFTPGQLSTATGGTAIKGGLTYDDSGRLIFGSDVTDTIWAFDETDSSFTELFDHADLVALIGTSITFNDIFYAPDGWVYFQENSTDHVLGFDLDDPSTLSIVLTKSDLRDPNGAGHESVAQFAWYNGNLAWNTGTPAGSVNQGFYAIPEPASLALLGVSMLLVARRRGH